MPESSSDGGQEEHRPATEGGPRQQQRLAALARRRMHPALNAVVAAACLFVAVWIRSNSFVAAAAPAASAEPTVDQWRPYAPYAGPNHGQITVVRVASDDQPPRRDAGPASDFTCAEIRATAAGYQVTAVGH